MTQDTGSFTLNRILPLPAAKLWEVLTDAKHREVWGTPDPGVVLIVDSSDLRVGGQDRHRCGPADSPEFLVDTRWYHLTAPELAVFTETVIFGGAPAFTSLVTYALAPGTEGTSLTLTVATSSLTGPDALREVAGGWNNALSTLENYAGSRIAAH